MCSLVLAVLIVGQAPPVFTQQEGPAAAAPSVFSPPDKAVSRIVIYTATWCTPCQKWKEECEDDLRDAGWKIEKREPGNRTVPHFVVHVGKYKEEFSGYSTRSEHMDRIRQVIANANPKKKQAKFTIRRGYGSGDWTWPGGPSVAALERHLAGPPHNLDPNQLRGMSDAALIRLHDSRHNSGTSAAQPRRTYVRRRAPARRG